ncbi:hypothetical protein TNCV_4256171 [Trichonephila clavipes]|nr:hypothetical protein TNCV_4256171 [Trichonephila clavipes]
MIKVVPTIRINDLDSIKAVREPLAMDHGLCSSEEAASAGIPLIKLPHQANGRTLNFYRFSPYQLLPFLS